jgi:hypothetical protein
VHSLSDRGYLVNGNLSRCFQRKTMRFVQNWIAKECQYALHKAAEVRQNLLEVQMATNLLRFVEIGASVATSLERREPPAARLC